MNVLIIGGGPVGLTLASELTRHGAPCRMVDRLPERTRFCRALGVQSRTLEVFDDMGIVQEALDRGLPLRGNTVHKDGKLVASLELAFEAGEEIPYPIALSLAQPETEAILDAHLSRLGGRVERGISLESFVQSDTGVDVTLRHADGREERTRCDWLVGCDGAHSTVRKTLEIGFEGHAYPYTFLIGDVRVRWGLEHGYGHRLLTREGNVAVAVPMREPDRYRVSITQPEAAPEGGAEHGLLSQEGQAPTLAQMQEALDRVYPGATLEDPRWTSRFRVSERLATHYRRGRVFLAGDAAHIHAPAGGQGMNTGIQDAYNLAWKLALVTRGRAAPALLDTYEPERRPIAEGVLRESGIAFVSTPAKAPAPAKPPPAPDAREAFWKWAQLDLNYRGGPLGDASAPSPGPGDRAPDARIEGGRLHDLLRGTHFTVLSFGAEPGRAATHPLVRAHRITRPLWGASGAELVLVRPDGYVAARGGADEIAAWLDRWVPFTASR